VAEIFHVCDIDVISGLCAGCHVSLLVVVG